MDLRTATLQDTFKMVNLITCEVYLNKDMKVSTDVFKVLRYRGKMESKSAKLPWKWYRSPRDERAVAVSKRN